MVLGIISIVLGAILGIRFFLMDPNGASQQTVQYLGFVCSSIFLVGGFILIQLRNGFENIKVYYGSTNSENISSGTNLNNISPNNPTTVNYGDSWTCKKCNEKNPNTSPTCKSCGAYK